MAEINQFSIEDIATMYGHPYSTTKKHIAKLKEQKRFEKSSLGKFYNLDDLKKLASLLNFRVHSGPLRTT